VPPRPSTPPQIHNEKFGGGHSESQYEDGVVTPLIRRTIATYMAAKALIGCLTPDYDELQKVVVTPKGSPTGYVYFIPQDAHLESRITTRSFMESHLVVRAGLEESGRIGGVGLRSAALSHLTHSLSCFPTSPLSALLSHCSPAPQPQPFTPPSRCPWRAVWQSRR